MVALKGGSSNHTSLLRRLAQNLPTLLRGRLRTKTIRKRQVQRRLSPPQQKKLVAEYQAGDSMQKLAKRWHLHRTTVTERLRQAGVAVRRGIPLERFDEAISLYGEGWSCQRLARRYGCDDETVRQTLRRAGVRLRQPWERRRSW
jgi:DNA-directed RNA polymerase specialized sigma24 family protein